MEEETPPPRRLTLKPREAVPPDPDRPLTGDGTAVTIPLMHLQNKLAEQKPADATGERFAPASPRPAAIAFGTAASERTAEAAPMDPAQSEEDQISIHRMLRANEMAARMAEPELIAMPKPTRSRRMRDFAFLVGIAALAVGGLLLVFRHDREMVALALFIIVFVTVILAWVMFGVMERY
jgi:hypothetical protein